MGEDHIFDTYPDLPSAVVAFIKEIISIIKGLYEKISGLESQVEHLKNENQELHERLNLNSRNSSLPPRSDGYRKPCAKRAVKDDCKPDNDDSTPDDTSNEQVVTDDEGDKQSESAPPKEKVSKNRSLRVKSGKKVGGQVGHKGHGFKLNGNPNSIEEHVPDDCKGCPNKDTCDQTCRKRAFKQNEVDIELRSVLTQHDTYNYECPMRGETLYGVKPFKGTNCYGPTVVAFILLLSLYGVVSVKRIAEIFKGLFGRKISTGTVQSIITSAKGKVKGAVKLIRKMLIASDINHHDETGIRVDGVLKWLHVATNSKFTLLTVHAKRGKLGILAAGVLGKFKGIIVTDCWAPYFKFKKVIHAICNAHLIRELNNRWINTHQFWTLRIIHLLTLMNSEKKALIKKGIYAFSPERLSYFETKFKSFIDHGLSRNPLPPKTGKKGRPKKGKTRALLERMQTLQSAIFLFAYDFRVPFTNNEAERELRCARVKENMSGCFRTEVGSEGWASVMSYIKTAAKSGITAYDALVLMDQGRACELISNISKIEVEQQVS